jgi:hypothetical protein
MFPQNPKRVILIFDNLQITGKDCQLTSCEYNIPSPIPLYSWGSRNPIGFERTSELCNIKLNLVATSLECAVWDKEFKPKIRDKRVEDCTVQELLFAVRKKLQ